MSVSQDELAASFPVCLTFKVLGNTHDPDSGVGFEETTIGLSFEYAIAVFCGYVGQAFLSCELFQAIHPVLPTP
jgi:hypothetical protein